VSDPIRGWIRTVHWNHGTFEVQSLGGMIGPAQFKLGHQTVQPFKVAQWKAGENSEPSLLSLPGILHRLRGDWACVPFGSTRNVEQVSEGWHTSPSESLEQYKSTIEIEPHGISSNKFWDLAEFLPNKIVLEISYPSSHPIAKLRRTITPDTNSPRINFSLEVFPRESVKLPIGLHPTFKLADIKTTHLVPGKFQFGVTFPGILEPTSVFKPGQKFLLLNEVPRKEGGSIDVSKLPIDENSENLVQLCNIDGSFVIENHQEKYKVELKWEPKHYNSVILWMSNKGRPYFPWDGNFTALGVEPVCAAFDLGHISTEDNPLTNLGVKTAIQFNKDEVWTTHYSIGVAPL